MTAAAQPDRATGRQALTTVPVLGTYVRMAAARLAVRLGPGVAATAVQRSAGQLTGVGRDPGHVALATQVGPVTDALSSSQVLAVPDVLTTDRWPAWRSAAEEAQVRSALVAPARSGARCAVAIAVLGPRPRRWTAMEVMAADTAAQEVARAVQLCESLLTSAPAPIRRSGEAALLVDQAVQALVEQTGVDVLQALRELRRAVADHGGDVPAACRAATGVTGPAESVALPAP
ncbi:GAF domain-containing protein [Actinotalea sp. Marseille-Q4924]|uniref:GAF domain-containing protein n=1 Tax=Actinotalea sp. Marseille-Q4924 TaxID=2866571 RepID=UPI001CE3C5FF|nr:GAF domain-containing protein [Actinotalea sp. Marseille-Q4924]